MPEAAPVTTATALTSTPSRQRAVHGVAAVDVETGTVV